MKEYSVSSGKKLLIPSLYEIHQKQTGMDPDQFTQYLIEQIREVFNSSVLVDDSEETFQKLIFTNWIYTSIYIDLIYEYLTTGSGTPQNYVENIELDESIVHEAIESLTQGKLKEKPSGITFNTDSIQKAWNEYDKENLNVFYNLIFNIFYKDWYLLPILYTLTDTFKPSSILHAELFELVPLLAGSFNGEFAKAFESFENSLYESLAKNQNN